MRLLDSDDVDAHARTFTDDATFDIALGGGRVSHRATIADAMRCWDRNAGTATQRRHWMRMIDVAPVRPDSIVATIYLLEISTPAGSTPEIAQSAVIHDVLTRVNGRLLTQSRKILGDPL